MEYMILGLLYLQERTIYELRERIRQGLSLIYSDSMGSIQHALHQLSKKGLITHRQSTENGRNKKCYFITDAGKQQFIKWINAPMEEATMRMPELGKIYFMGLAEPENRIASISKHIDYLKQQSYILETICEEGALMQAPSKLQDLFHYQLLCAQYGRDFMRFHIAWYERLLKQLKEEQS